MKAKFKWDLKSFLFQTIVGIGIVCGASYWNYMRSKAISTELYEPFKRIMVEYCLRSFIDLKMTIKYYENFFNAFCSKGDENFSSKIRNEIPNKINLLAKRGKFSGIF